MDIYGRFQDTKIKIGIDSAQYVYSPGEHQTRCDTINQYQRSRKSGIRITRVALKDRVR